MVKPAALYRSMAAMHRAGIPWPRAVESAARGDAAFLAVRRDLEDGRSFAESFAPVVDPLDAALLEAGEKGGSLEHALEEMAQSHERRDRLRADMQVRRIYPYFLAHVAALLMAVPDLLQGRPVSALGWAALALVPTWTWIVVQRRLGRRERPAAGGSPPEPPPRIGEFRNRADEADARAFEALGRLYEAGVPLLDALPLAARSGWGGRAAPDLTEARGEVERGGELWRAFRRMPDEFVNRIRSAEESGALGTTMLRIADELNHDVEIRRRKTAQIVPVIMILAIGLIVALRLFSFYGDYYGRLSDLMGP